MGKIIFILLSLGCIGLFNPLKAQLLYQNLVPCAANPNNPDNAWDWRAPIFTAFVINNNGAQVVNISSPFFAGANANTQFLANSPRDFEPEDGWELVKKDMGTVPDVDPNYPLGRFVFAPYFILYNKYTGVLRFAMYLDGSEPALQTFGTAYIEVAFLPFATQPALLDFFSGNNYRNSLDEFVELIPMIPTLPIRMISNAFQSTPYWLMADFPMNYDPCTCNSFSRIFFKVWVRQISNLNITIPNTNTQFLSTTGVAEGTGGKHFLIRNRQGQVNAGPGTYFSNRNAIEKVKNAYASTSTNNFSTTLSKVIPGSEAIIEVADFMIAPVAKNEMVKPIYFNLNLNSSGQVLTDNPTASVSLNNPGAYLALDSTATETLHYNNVMGVFNVLEKPKVSRTQQQGVMNVWAYYPAIDCYRFKLDEDIRYLVNPNANFKSPAKIEANWVFEFDNNAAPAVVDMFWKSCFNRKGVYFQNDSTLVSYPVPIACFKDLDVAFSTIAGGTFRAFVKLTALLETDEEDSRQVLFMAKYPIQTFDVPLGSIPNGSFSSITENLILTSASDLDEVTRAWNSIDIKIAENAILDNLTLTAGNEIRLERGSENPTGFTLLNPGVTLEVGNVSKCNDVLYACNDPINNPDCSDYVRVFCRDEQRYKQGRGYPLNNRPSRDTENEPIVQISTTQLHAAYPNPTTEGLVNFTYELAESGNVMLYLSNAMGEQVAVLVNNQRQESGTHQFSFDVSQLPSGVYFYTLETNGFKQHKRLVVIR